jgi:hypothetical protein
MISTNDLNARFHAKSSSQTPTEQRMANNSRTRFPVPNVILAATLLWLTACASIGPRPATPIADVINASKDRQPEQVIESIRASRTTYALKGSDFAKLARAGVPLPALDHLQQAFVNDVDLLTRYWAQGGGPGGCVSCYPQPLDLANLASGGNGMGDTGGITHRAGYRPQGLPDWVMAYPARIGQPPITLAQIESQVKSGVPSEELAARIRGSRLDGVVPQPFKLRLSTHDTAGVSGSEFAYLARDGASDDVLDAVQQKFIAQFIEFARLGYIQGGPAPGGARK